MRRKPNKSNIGNEARSTGLETTQMGNSRADESGRPLTGKKFASELSYMLEPYIPKEHEEFYRHFRTMLSNILPQAQIARNDVPRYLKYFDCFWQGLLIEGVRLPTFVWDSARMLLELQLTRSIEGFQSKLSHGAMISGQPEEAEMEEKSSSWRFWER